MAERASSMLVDFTQNLDGGVAELRIAAFNSSRVRSGEDDVRWPGLAVIDRRSEMRW